MMKRYRVHTDDEKVELLEKNFIDVKDLFARLTHDEIVSLRRLVPFQLDEIEPHDKVKKRVLFNAIVKDAPIQFAKLFGCTSLHWEDGDPVIWI